MTFVFAYIGSLTKAHDWPVELMHQTETAFAIVAAACIVLAVVARAQPADRLQPARVVIAAIGGLCASFALIMPFELAPFFFGSRGEIMMMSIALNLAYPVEAGLFIMLFLKIADSNVFGSDDQSSRPPRR